MKIWLRNQWHRLKRNPYLGGIRFGDLGRLTPIGREFGFDRGLPIDRYYIEEFLSAQATAIRGHVLEVGDDIYTYKFGSDHITQSDVLHVREGEPKATLIADLTSADHIPSDRFDCIILTQTLHLIYDVKAALRTIYRILAPGGIVLATFPGISQKSQDEWGKYWYWGFTSLSAQGLFEEIFPQDNIHIETYGNVFVAIAFLHGLATHELPQEALDYRDSSYETLITVRATKPGEK